MSKSEAQESSITDPTSDSRFECPICLSWLRDPVLTSCGHKFCKLCIESWLQKEGTCPIDHMKLIPATDLFSDNFTRREINQHITNCPYIHQGCKVKLSPLDLDAHITICPHKIDNHEIENNNIHQCNCLFHDIGCLLQFESNEQVHEHMKTNMEQHLTLLLNVYSQLKTSQHESPSTSADNKSQESFFWDPPAKGGSSSEETKDTLHNLLKMLYEKIVVLEQKSREQDIIITNMSHQISAQNTKIQELPLRYCNGLFFWTVTDFQSKLEEMYTNPKKKMFYSPPFYTSPNGYKLCMRLNLSPNDTNYLALILHVMKTEHDFMLDWPFNARITIILTHPSTPDINIRETMLTNPDLEAFRRPTQSLNLRGFGYTEFALISDLQSEGFIQNNEIHIKIQVFTP